MKYNLDYLETHVVDHCNLNCKACCHYCNVTEPNFIDINSFTQDMIELAKKFDIKMIRLMGGEPLLAPDITAFMENTRKCFPGSDIRIVTNGILLHTMDESFWECIAKNKIRIDLTKYPIPGTSFSKALDAIGEHLHRFYRNDKLGFFIQENSFGGMWIATQFQLTMNSNGINDISESFNKCPYKRCINLINGHLAHCPTAGYIHNYNKYFGTNMPEEKGIGIYDNAPEKILAYLNTPIPTCKYCVFDEDVKLQKWDFSRKEKDEWFVNKIQ